MNPNLEKDPFKLTIKFPSEYLDTIQFKYSLKPINSVLNYNRSVSNPLMDNMSYNEHLNLYVISELILKENAITFKIISLPQAGHYNFTVFANIYDENYENLEPYPYRPIEYKAIACFRVSCTKAIHFETPPNHITDITVFGMNNIMKRLGLSCHDFKQGVLGMFHVF